MNVKSVVMLFVCAILISIFGTILYLDEAEYKLTGKVPGNISMRISSSVSIHLNNAFIDFGVGFVNTSKVLCTSNATLIAEGVFNDTNGNWCWSNSTTLSAATGPKGLLIENDGNVNVSINITGPTEAQFFKNYVGAYPTNISFKSRSNETSACAANAVLQTTWTSFEGMSKNACTRLNYQPSTQDELAIDIRVILPADLVANVYNTTLDITALQAS